METEFQYSKLVPEHLEPDEVVVELEKRGVKGIQGHAEQRRALKALLREEEEHPAGTKTTGDVEDMRKCVIKVSQLMRTLEQVGTDPYAVRVLYSRWASVGRRLQEVGEDVICSHPEAIQAVCVIQEAYNAYYRTTDRPEDEEEISKKLLDFSLSKPRAQLPTEPNQNMSYRTVSPIISSRDSSPANDNRENAWRDFVTRGNAQMSSVTTGAIKKTIQNPKNPLLSARLPRSATPFGRNDEVSCFGTLDHGPTTEENRTSHAFFRGDEKKEGISFLKVPVAKDGRNLGVVNEFHRPSKVVENPRVEQRQEEPIRENVEQQEHDARDDLFVREYDAMCDELMEVVQTTVRNFLESRSPRPARRATITEGVRESVSPTQSARVTAPGVRGRDDTRDVPGLSSGTKGMPVSKWKIDKFDGKEEGLARFLTRVNQFAMAEGATKADLFRNKIHLFSGHAADFVALSTHISDWDELVEEIIKFSMGSTSDCDVLRKIQERKQGKRESCAVYVTEMEMMFRSLRQPLPEGDRCDVIIRGFRPAIRSALAGNTQLQTLHELRLAAQRVEGFTPISWEANEIKETSAVEQKNRRRTVSPRPGTFQKHSSTTRKDFCFNCGDKTHHQNRCDKPKQILCYACGKVGVYATQCCWKGSGNGPRRV